jgi:tRNA(Ile)-lysidine synthetase-like protein
VRRRTIGLLMSAVSHDVGRPSPVPDVDTDSIDAAASALLRASRDSAAPLVLAVSGGADSMVLMDAVARARSALASLSPDVPVTVVTFDHGTGPFATRAAMLVAEEGGRLGFDVRVGRAALAGATEAEWRAARWRFFREACGPGAIIATAHTRDDQVETVVMRVLRGAGARGLAALTALSGGVARPFLRISRSAVRRYASGREVLFIDDPSNESRAYLRNRIRHDLLPAIRTVRPLFEEELLNVSDDAAQWRAAVDDMATAFVSERADDGAIRVARGELATYDSAALCVLWPAIAARALVTLDRRGTLRLAQFTTSGAPGARIQLSGGVEVIRHRDSFVLQRVARDPAAAIECSLAGVVEFGLWRFQPVLVSNARDVDGSAPDTAPDDSAGTDRDDPWTCDLPGDRPLSIREWRPADRMRGREDGSARRVKRFFGDAHIPGPSRVGWPVVLVDNEIVWIPGVRRRVAAPERSGRPVIRYACERFVSRHPGN